MFLMRTSVVVLLPAAVVLPGSGCRSVGPATVTRDRQDYVTAVGDSRNEQLLLNIVKLRYGEAPTFLDVVSVVSGYSLETGVSLNGQFSPQNRQEGHVRRLTSAIPVATHNQQSAPIVRS